MTDTAAQEKIMKPICIYHGNCADGFAAAWVVRRALGDGVDFHAGIYQDPPPDVSGRGVIMVDFSYKAAVLNEMRASAAWIRIIDHHKSAIEDLRGNLIELDHLCPVELIFDLDRSGAGLTWDTYFPGDSRPALINHIEDRDLWRFKLDGTREIQANVFSYPYDFALWDNLMERDCQDLRAEGAAIERKHFKDIREFITAAGRTMVIAGQEVPALNAPYFWSSDAGHIMAENAPFAACYWDTPDGRVFSLRSRPGGADVSEIAKQYGGGGHKNAAGFRVPFDHKLGRA